MPPPVGREIEESDKEELPDEVPDPSPATPTPVRLGPMELKQTERIDQPERPQPGLLTHKRATATINKERG
jgi:hypothetical protein